MSLEVLAQTCDGLFLCLAFEKLVLQCEESRGLHCVEDLHLETAVCIEESGPEVILGLSLHGLISCSVLSCCCRHVAHHACIDGPVRSAEVVPVLHGFRKRYALTLCVMGECSAAAAFERFVAEPVRPLVVAILSYVCVVVVFRLVYMVHETLHRVPVLLYHGLVAELLPDRPRHDDAGVSPSQTHHFVAVLSVWCDSREASERALRIPHVAHPFVHESAGVGEEGTCFGKYLCISCPAKSLVSLRTVCRDAEIVGFHTPDRVGDELVYEFVSSRNASCLHAGCDRCHRYGLY